MLMNFAADCQVVKKSLFKTVYEPRHDKTNKMACAPSEDSDQPGHLPSLIRVFAVHMKKPWVLNYQSSAQRRLWSDWADAQADLSRHLAHTHFVGFVMSQPKWQITRNEPGHEKMCLMSYANNKGADQPVHPHSLISAFVVRCLDSIISLDSIAEISRT